MSIEEQQTTVLYTMRERIIAQHREAGLLARYRAVETELQSAGAAVHESQKREDEARGAFEEAYRAKLSAAENQEAS